MVKSIAEENGLDELSMGMSGDFNKALIGRGQQRGYQSTGI